METHLEAYTESDLTKADPEPNPPPTFTPKPTNAVKETVVTVREVPMTSQAIGLAPVLPTKAIAKQRKPSIHTEVPRQTILKAMASRSSALMSPPVAPLGITGFPPNNQETEKNRPQNEQNDATSITSSSLTSRLVNLRESSTLSPQTASLLHSPCFFHQRFDGIVDVQKVLEETSEEDYSHSRLMQTATGVREISKQLQRRPLKRAVKSVMIVTRARDNSLVYLTKELAEWLMATPRYGSDLGVNVYVDAKLRKSKRFDAEGLIAKQPRYKNMLKFWTPDFCWSCPEKFDLVLTLGGDGTVLFTSWLFQRVVPPVLSFALGSLGFLTNFEFDRYKEHLDRIMGDIGMRVNLRMRFTCTVWRTDTSPSAEKGAMEEGEQFEVLNELVIDRGPSAYVSNLELYGDNELLTIVQADGCIFSTPTGSTAYSLSAGGSLIHPSIPAILLTPICPHTLSFRPMVLSDALALRIAVPLKSRSSAYCSFDGKGRIELKRGDYVTLEASQYPFPTVMTGTNEWVESVQRALRWNVRGAEQKGWDDPVSTSKSKKSRTPDDEYDENENEDEDDEEEKWDIDIDSSNAYYAGGTDSGIGPSEDGEQQSVNIGDRDRDRDREKVGGINGCMSTGSIPGTGNASPMRRQISLLNM